jgi:hypothetical protein
MNKYKFEIETPLKKESSKIQLLSCEFLASNIKEAKGFSQSLFRTWMQSVQSSSPEPIRVLNLTEVN